MEKVRAERLKAYAFLVIFVAGALVYGRAAAKAVTSTLGAAGSTTATLMIVGAVVVSLLTVVPLLTTFKVSEAPKVLENMREKARKSGKKVTVQSAGRTVSFYAVALAATPMLYGVVLIFLLGQFTAMLLLLPATVILAVVGWFVVGRLMQQMSTLFLK